MKRFFFRHVFEPPLEKVREWAWVLLASFSILVISSIPIWVGYLTQTPGRVFIGTFYDQQDYAVHLTMMQAGIQGDWAYSLHFTAEPHQAVYIRLFYIALGHLTHLLHLEPEMAFQLARWVFGLLALAAVYQLASRIFPEVKWRRTAFLLATTGAGFGWLQMSLGWIPDPHISPVDFWLIDSYIFFSLMLFPHFSAVTALLAAVLTTFLDYLQGKSRFAVAFIALAAILTQLINPIAFVLADAAMLGALLFTCCAEKRVRWRKIAGLAIIAAAQIPLLIYTSNILIHDPLWSQFTAQNLTLSPLPVYYLWGFGLFWPLAMIGTLQSVRSRDMKPAMAILWVIAALTLAYLPMAIQRRFLHAFTLPLAILATLGLKTIFGRRSLVSRQAFYTALFISLTALTSLILSLRSTLDILHYPMNFSYPQILEEAVHWLGDNASPDDVVLASESTSQIVAAHTGLRVYFGHTMETLDYNTKAHQAWLYFNGKSDAGWLDSTSVQWVIYGPYEKNLSSVGTAFLPAPSLKPVYQDETIIIYRVKK